MHTVGVAPSLSQIFPHAPRFALVHDDQDSAFLLQRQLRKAFPGAVIIELSSRSLRAALAEARVDMAIIAYRLVGLTGLELIARLRDEGETMPLALISGMQVYRQRAFEVGADAFVTYGEAQEFSEALGPLLRALRHRAEPAPRCAS